MTDPEAITRDELAEALRRRHLDGCGHRDDALAEMLFEDALAHREPEYEPGAMYQDAQGKNWEYRPHPDNYGCPWLMPGSQAAYSAISPKRPLRKLVPKEDCDD